MKTSGTSMKEQFKIHSIGSNVDSIKKQKTRISKVCYIWFFAGTALASLALVIVFWHTNIFENAILASLALKNGTQTFTWWEQPPVNPLLKVRIFNYTNLEEYRDGNASKLHVEEVGPYIYRQKMTRVGVKLNENGTVSYQENATVTWEGGSFENETIRVPNVPLIMAVQMAKDVNGYLHYPINVLLDLLKAEPFKVLTVKEYLWGYTDDLFSTAVNLRALIDPLPFETFGMLMTKDRLSMDRITIHTGLDDINNLGLYEKFNGMETRDVWNDKECDKVEGTDGTMFPPNLIRDRNATLDIYTQDLCRKFPLRFHSDGTAFDIPTLRYKPIKDIFTASETTNTCFCRKITESDVPKVQTCPPAGVFDMSVCNYGLPLLMSFPHFYTGEKILLNEVEGLNPKKELHESYVDIHPRLGIPIGGWSRLQVNVRVSVVQTIPILEPLKDGMILPIMWFEMGVEEMPETVLTTLWHAYFTVSIVESFLQWGSLLSAILSICAMAFMMKRHRESEMPKWQNNMLLKTGI